MNLPEGLLAAVKNYLDITWEDAGTDEKLSRIIANGIIKVNGYAGTDKDYMQAGRHQALLFDYCRYARDNALELFEKNFISEITGLIVHEEVDNYEQTNI